VKCEVEAEADRNTADAVLLTGKSKRVEEWT
jgi:hypothetical protein